MYQKVTVVGNVGRDAEMRQTGSGTNVTNFSVATNRSWTNKDGVKQEQTTWFRISAWGKLAEICNTYVKSGMKVLVDGTLVADEHGNPKVFESNSGEHKASFELSAQTVTFLSSSTETPSSNGTARAAKTEEPVAEIDFDEIPF